MNADDPFGDETDADGENTVFQRRDRRPDPFAGGGPGADGVSPLAGATATAAGGPGGDAGAGADQGVDPDATVMMPGGGGQAHLDALLTALETARATAAADTKAAETGRVELDPTPARALPNAPRPPSGRPAPSPPLPEAPGGGGPAAGPGLIGDDWDAPGGGTLSRSGAPSPHPSPPPTSPSSPPPPPPPRPPPPPPPPPLPVAAPPPPPAQADAPRVGPAEHAEATLFGAAAGEPGPFTQPEPAPAPTPAPPPTRAQAGEPRRVFVPGRHRDADTLDDDSLVGAGLNPLLGNATALLALAARLRDGPGVADLDGLRERVIAEVRRFDQGALAAGLAPEDVRMARYAICATVDDLILSTEWGAASGWAGRSLVSTIYSETWGGERFFDILDHLLTRPGNNLEVLELMAVCLALGFVGKYRVMPQGQSELAEVRDNLFRTLRQLRGDFDRALSPHWRGLEMAHKPPPSSLVPLLVAAIVAVGLAILYMVLSATLTARTEVVTRDLIEAVPVGPPSILRPEVAPPPLPAPVVTPSVGLYDRLSMALAPEIALRQLELVRDDQMVTLRLLGGGTFASATATVRDSDMPLLQRIGVVLERERGPVVVVGHTDSQPIRTARFPSNYDLSLARATAVVAVLGEEISDPTRLRAEGAADRDPLASNATREGRARNRRIEIVVPETAAASAPSGSPAASEATGPGREPSAVYQAPPGAGGG